MAGWLDRTRSYIQDGFRRCELGEGALGNMAAGTNVKGWPEPPSLRNEKPNGGASVSFDTGIPR
jgi:hypothetical protein